jgi:hypothetical protein
MSQEVGLGGPGPVSRLAARFRKAVEDRDAARRQAEEAAKKATEEASAARAELLRDLATLAREIGSLVVKPEGDGLTLRYGERYLHFGPSGEGDRVRIEFEGMGDEEHVLYRQSELGHRWVYSRQRRFREDRIPLFDAGIEDLLVRGLGLPPPGDDPMGDDPIVEPAPAGPGRKKL